MRDFTLAEISLSPSLHVGEGSDNSLEGAQLRSVVDEAWSDPEEYEHATFEEKLALADEMICRWQRYRDAVVAENSIPH